MSVLPDTWIEDVLRIARDNDLLLIAFGRRDVEREIGRDLTDDEWQRVCRTYAWRSGHEAIVDQDAVESVVWGSITEAGLEVRP